ncbi:MAG: carboxypeptidase regulatory-like domain-containing protein [Pyrinomonadaceae bacterium]|nr:carboxypeptidase regulatory-like domain-containing protein [Pyrinomonadaceae bacterium]
MNIKHLSRVYLNIIFLMVLTIFFIHSGQSVYAATIIVNTTVDENGTGTNCSLREAINAANTDAAFGGCTAGAGADLIGFSALFSTAQTIQSSVAEFTINTAITINGPGANILTLQNVIPAGPNSRVFRVGTAGVLNLNGVAVTGGNTTAGNGGAGLLVSGVANLTNVYVNGNTADGYGGGLIYETAGTTSTITNTTISNNSSNGSAAGGGGSGIDNSANLTITSSTISGNTKTGASGNGGGIFNFSGNLALTSTTITDNSAAGAGSGGGVFRFGGTVSVRNTIIAANRNNATTPDVIGAYTSSGYNLIGNLGTATGFTGTADQTNVSNANVNLSSLGFNGGQTPTHVPVFNSFAVDKGNNFGILTDQRATTRPFDSPTVPNASGGNGTDIGAVEIPRAVAAGVFVSGRVSDEAGGGVGRAVVYVTDQNGVTRTVKTNSFGNFIFTDLQAGQTYIFTVFAKQYQFDPQVVTVSENVSDLNFTPQGANLKR